MDVRCSPTWGFTHHQRGNAAIVLFERQYMERVWVHDSFIFFSMTVLFLFSASVGLNYLSYIRRKKNCLGIQGHSKWRELSVRYTNTPTHIHISGITSDPRTCRIVYINMHTHIECDDRCRVHFRTPTTREILVEDRERKREERGEICQKKGD